MLWCWELKVHTYCINALVWAPAYGCCVDSFPWKYYKLTFRGNFPGGFLSLKPSIPKSLLLNGKHTIGSHFNLINYQVCMYWLDPSHFCIWNGNYDITPRSILHLVICDEHEFVQMKQIRTALAIASLLNRTLVRTTFWGHNCLSYYMVGLLMSHFIISTLKKSHDSW